MLKHNILANYCKELDDILISYFVTKYFVEINILNSKNVHGGITFLINSIIKIETTLPWIINASDWYIISYYCMHMSSHPGEIINFFQQYCITNNFDCYDDWFFFSNVFQHHIPKNKFLHCFV